MTVRTSSRTVTFTKPFTLKGFDEELPAGVYQVETDEERIQDVSFPAFRRILTIVHLHPKPGHPGTKQTLSIRPEDLDAALARDQSCDS
jgi:hypothetical protein